MVFIDMILEFSIPTFIIGRFAVKEFVFWVIEYIEIMEISSRSYLGYIRRFQRSLRQAIPIKALKVYLFCIGSINRVTVSVINIAMKLTWNHLCLRISLTPLRPLPRRSDGNSFARWRIIVADERLILSNGIENDSKPFKAILKQYILGSDMLDIELPIYFHSIGRVEWWVTSQQFIYEYTQCIEISTLIVTLIQNNFGWDIFRCTTKCPCLVT